ncbi:MAG: PEP-CTERM sorting domain-containing protein [Planctomycetota bacterium]|jgi:hypothetical protein
MRATATTTVLLVTIGATSAALADATVTFENGTEGWTGPAGPGGATTVEPDGGNPGAHLHTIFNNFGIEFRTSTNTDFVTDYTAFGSVTLSVDVKVEDISFFGTPASRPWVLDLRSSALAQGGYPWTSVWFEFDWISAGQYGDWTTFTVTIEDPTSTELPPGWGGYGDETPLAEPILPPGVTFADVLASIDEVALTTLEPGWFFGFTDFDVRIDNIAIQTTGGSDPCPSDVDGDGETGVDDLVAIILAWGVCSGCPEDITGDDRVNVDDLVGCILEWGPCP